MDHGDSDASQQKVESRRELGNKRLARHQTRYKSALMRGNAEGAFKVCSATVSLEPQCVKLFRDRLLLVNFREWSGAYVIPIVTAGVSRCMDIVHNTLDTVLYSCGD